MIAKIAIYAIFFLAFEGTALASGSLIRTARIQSLTTNGGLNDIYDAGVQSPKSALFSEDGKKLYINALEGGQTLVYSFPDLKPIKTISHVFGPEHASLFMGETTVFNYTYFYGKQGQYNHFLGKESKTHCASAFGTPNVA